MNFTLKETDLAIITNEPVAKTFDNEPAYLHATIEPVDDSIHFKTRKYRVRTDLAIYKKQLRYELNEAGDLIGKEVFVLTATEQRQDWSYLVFSYAEIDAFASELAGVMPAGLSKTERDSFELASVFLKLRKESLAWGVASESWRLRNENDLLKTDI